jgi:hypothetical protein
MARDTTYCLQVQRATSSLAEEPPSSGGDTATALKAEYLAAKAAYVAARTRLRRARTAFELSPAPRRELFRAKKAAIWARDYEIHDRYCAGEDLTALASEFSLALSSVGNIVRRVGHVIGQPVAVRAGYLRPRGSGT